MRINLKVPYAQKDAAKELGARWDATRKIWYVVDPESIEVFSDWMPEVHEDAASAATTARAKPTATASATAATPRAGVFTGPRIFKPVCDCAALPWAHCQHTEHA